MLKLLIFIFTIFFIFLVCIFSQNFLFNKKEHFTEENEKNKKKNKIKLDILKQFQIIREYYSNLSKNYQSLNEIYNNENINSLHSEQIGKLDIKDLIKNYEYLKDNLDFSEINLENNSKTSLNEMILDLFKNKYKYYNNFFEDIDGNKLDLKELYQDDFEDQQTKNNIVYLYKEIKNNNNDLYNDIIEEYKIIIDYSKNVKDNEIFSNILVLFNYLFVNFFELNNIFDFMIDPFKKEEKKKNYSKKKYNEKIKIINNILEKLKNSIVDSIIKIDKSKSDYPNIVNNFASYSDSLTQFCKKYRELNKPSEDKLILDKILKMKKGKKILQIDSLRNKINKLQKDILYDDIDKYNSFKNRTHEESSKMINVINKTREKIENANKVKINLI